MMTPIFLNPPSAARYFNLHQDHQEDQQQQLLLATSPFCPTIVDQGFRMSDQSQPFNDQLEVNSTNSYGSQTHDLFIFKHQKDQEQNNLISPDPNNGSSSLRWMSSKMRMMRKVINSKTDPRDGPRLIIPSSTNNPQLEIINNVIRTCSDCNTTRTPLWRSGPQGPKTLCNACGIRQRKARKAAMEAAAAATNTSSTEASSSTSNKKKSRLTSNSNSNKKQTPCKDQTNELADSDQSNNSSSSKQQLRFEEFAVDLLSKNASFHRMFPQDEEEGALLLMALSYGLIQS